MGKQVLEGGDIKSAEGKGHEHDSFAGSVRWQRAREQQWCEKELLQPSHFTDEQLSPGGGPPFLERRPLLCVHVASGSVLEYPGREE